MTAAQDDPNGLREALARAVEAGATNGRTTTEIVGDLFAPGSPLASLIAERDAAAKRNAEEFALRSEAPGDPWEMVRHLEEQCRTFIRGGNEWKAVADREVGLLRAAEAEITRLKEGMEAAVGALGEAAHINDWCSDPTALAAGRRARTALATLSPKGQP